MISDLAWLRSKVASDLGFDIDNIDPLYYGTDDWPEKKIDSAINETKDELWVEMGLLAEPDRIVQRHSLTWPANQVELELPTWLQNATIEQVVDITEGEPGYQVNVGKSCTSNGWYIFWAKAGVLSWGVSGPDSAKTIRFLYVGDSPDLKTEIDTVDFIPERYKWTLSKGARIKAKSNANEEAPQLWVAEYVNMRNDFLMWAVQDAPRTNFSYTQERSRWTWPQTMT